MTFTRKSWDNLKLIWKTRKLKKRIRRSMKYSIRRTRKWMNFWTRLIKSEKRYFLLDLGTSRTWQNLKEHQRHFRTDSESPWNFQSVADQGKRFDGQRRQKSEHCSPDKSWVWNQAEQSAGLGKCVDSNSWVSRGLEEQHWKDAWRNIE